MVIVRDDEISVIVIGVRIKPPWGSNRQREGGGAAGGIRVLYYLYALAYSLDTECTIS
jgi:hypothetical protein